MVRAFIFFKFMGAATEFGAKAFKYFMQRRRSCQRDRWRAEMLIEDHAIIVIAELQKRKAFAIYCRFFLFFAQDPHVIGDAWHGTFWPMVINVFHHTVFGVVYPATAVACADIRVARIETTQGKPKREGFLALLPGIAKLA